MSIIKTDISVQNSLYEAITAVAKEMQISQNELFILAAQEYLARHHQTRLLESLNDAYSDGLDESEQTMLEAMRLHQRSLAEQSE